MGVRTGPPNKRPTPKPRNKQMDFNDEHYKWKEYSTSCPWRISDECKATAMMCSYMNCTPWHFLKTFRKSLVTHDEWNK